MIATLAFAAVMAQQPTAQATVFAPKFTKDEVVSYTAKVSGSDGGTDVMFDVQFDLTTKGEPKDGKTPCLIKFTKMLANFGGMEESMQADDVEVSLDKFGAPTDISMEGPTAVAYVALVTQYLPAKPMKVGDTYKAELALDGAKVTLDGSYAGEEDLDGKRYHVFKTKSSLTPSGQEAGNLTTKSFFDAMLGKVIRTESVISTPDGDFKLTVVATPKKK